MQWKPCADIDAVAIVRENFPDFFNREVENQVNTMEEVMPRRENEVAEPMFLAAEAREPM